MKKILINFAHPAYQRSVANRALVEAVKDFENVTLNDLYHQYPDQIIRVDREQELLENHDVIVFLHPLFWYSSPAILKEWQDLVLTHGWAYGSEGTALKGKVWQQATTAGGSADAYQKDGSNLYTIPELLRPFEMTARLCGMIWQEPFAVHGTNALSASELAGEADRFASLINQLSG